MDSLIHNPYFLGAYFGGIAGIFCLVKLRHWYCDWFPPVWRQHRWQDPHRDVFFDARWREWFAWRPVRTVGGRVVWWATVYRCVGNDYVDHDDWSWWFYGDIMDVLKEV